MEITSETKVFRSIEQVKELYLSAVEMVEKENEGQFIKNKSEFVIAFETQEHNTTCLCMVFDVNEPENLLYTLSYITNYGSSITWYLDEYYLITRNEVRDLLTAYDISYNF